MKIDKLSGTEARQILTAMIVDQVTLGRITAKWEPTGMFESQWCNVVANWCVDYYRHYSSSPGKSIVGLFQTWASKGKDKDTIALVEKFLGGLSGEYELLSKEVNSQYVIDMAAKYFTRTKLRRLSTSIEADLDVGALEDASKRVTDYGVVELSGEAGIDVMRDQEALMAAFAEKEEPLIVYPGALGQFFDDAFERDSFIAFMAPEKRGKTFWLIDVAWMGLLQRRKVAFFAVGDMSQAQMLRRIMTRAARRPLKPGVVYIPTNIVREDDERHATPSHKKLTFDAPLSWQAARKACKEVMKRKVMSKETLFRLSTHPNSSISVSGIDAQLKVWAREGWNPDVVVIDYADILAMPDGGTEPRNQTNAAWKQLRALSQRWHCCTVTATQADASSYDTDILKKSNFSEDKRKLAHVTGLVGINQTSEEKELGVCRLNWIVRREGTYSETHCVHVAGCMAVCSPAIRSCW
jgi:hypothetical protein